jgi:uroporphyrinogen decarboxylase
VIQLFDSWAGSLAADDYARAVLPYSRRVLEAVRGVPRIHFATGNPELLPLLADAPCEVVSVDWRIGLADAWTRVGDRGVQGNLDPAACLAPFDVVAARARAILADAGGRPGHVFNLGHGVLAGTDADTLARLTELVRRETEVAVV